MTRTMGHSQEALNQSLTGSDQHLQVARLIFCFCHIVKRTAWPIALVIPLHLVCDEFIPVADLDIGQ